MNPRIELDHLPAVNQPSLVLDGIVIVDTFLNTELKILLNPLGLQKWSNLLFKRQGPYHSTKISIEAGVYTRQCQPSSRLVPTFLLGRQTNN